ncbi:mevalonate kinase [Spirosoma luteolum]
MRVTTSTPGRICLFGEHLDYLGLPVIAAAISRRIAITAESDQTPSVRLDLPDLGGRVEFSISEQPLAYADTRDYFRSAINVLLREGYTFGRGLSGTVRGNIPINSGTSSSSALLVSWLNLLTHLADVPRPLERASLAELAYAAEVLEFGEPGGMMDHYATAVGQVIYLESTPAIHLRSLSPPLGTFVLGDSGEPKDTIGILSRVKLGMLAIDRRLRALDPTFSLHTAELTQATEFKDILSKPDYRLLKGTLANRDLLRQALPLLDGTLPLDHARFGQLLTEHQANLRDAQGISTPKIDRMLQAALDAGALGGKINGSGGGGCMFAYAPTDPERVAAAIEREGGRAYVITVADGTTATQEPVL